MFNRIKMKYVQYSRPLIIIRRNQSEKEKYFMSFLLIGNVRLGLCFYCTCSIHQSDSPVMAPRRSRWSSELPGLSFWWMGWPSSWRTVEGHSGDAIILSGPLRGGGNRSSHQCLKDRSITWLLFNMNETVCECVCNTRISDFCYNSGHKMHLKWIKQLGDDYNAHLLVS